MASIAVKSAKRSLDILELLMEREEGLTFTDIGASLGLPRSSLYGLLTTLVSSGWLNFDRASKTYALGVRTLEAGNAYLRAQDLPSRARPLMERIRDDLDETVQLSQLSGRFNVYVEKVDGRQALILASAVGRRLPAHATGVGKVLLAFLDPETLESLFEGVALERFTKHTITSKAALYRRLAQIREMGYGTDEEEYSVGVRCIAVPVRDRYGQVVAAMSVSAPAIRFGERNAERARALLLESSKELSTALGYDVRTTDPA